MYILRIIVTDVADQTIVKFAQISTMNQSFYIVLLARSGLQYF